MCCFQITKLLLKNISVTIANEEITFNLDIDPKITV